MADEVRVSEAQAEEAGEIIHLPGPSYQPVALAFGVAFVVVGVVISPFLIGVGLAITVVTLVRWVRDTRRETSQLPLEH
jgi:hypothetical protein